ncbi:MAG: SRPBCC domain-containing protein, partial [Mesorhizobium sp.]
MLQLFLPQAMANADTVMASAELPASPDEVIAALVTTEVERWWGSPETYR